MDSFSQRILDDVERRCKTYQLSNGTNSLTDDCSDDTETITDIKEKENLSAMNQKFATKHIDERDFDTDGNISILTERNSDETDFHKQYSIDGIDNGRLEIIYANSNIIKRNEGDGLVENALNNNAIPIGRKPALPPKPSNRFGSTSLSILRPKGFVQSARAAFFDRSPLLKSPPGKRDPAEMTLKERLALFEKNKGSALVPKAALGMSVSAKQIMNDTKCGNDQSKIPLLPNAATMKTVIVHQTSNSKVSIISNESIQEIVTPTTSSITQSPETETPEQPKEEEPKDLRYDAIKNQLNDVMDSFRRSSSPKSPPPPPPTKRTNKTDSIESESHIEAKCTINNKKRSGEIVIDNRLHVHKNDVKRAKTYHTSTFGTSLYGDLTPIVTTVAPAKRPDETIGLNDLHQNDPDRLLLNHDSHHSQQSKDEDSFSFDSPISSSKNCGNFDLNLSTAKKLDDFYDSSTVSENQNDDDVSMNTDTNIDASADEFDLQKDIDCQTMASTDQLTDDSLRSLFTDDESDSVGLTHTLSFYRKKQTENVGASPIQKIVYPTLSQSISVSNVSLLNDDNEQDQRQQQNEQVEEKIRKLLNDVSIQQHHIMQASHALNTCAASFEFSGSTESVVAEWKLLVTTHSREAAIQELTRLRCEKVIRKPNASKDNGRLIINEISIPLRQDYISKLATDAIWGHHLVCLLKMHDSEQVVATKTIPTLPGLLAVKFPDSLRLENVFADFKVTLEVYGMLAQPEILPHEIKYHIKPKKFAGIGIGFMTPKSKKSNETSRAQVTPIQSTNGENAIRKPNFRHLGSVEIDLSEVRRTNWPIHLKNDDSPLTGVLSMKINCELAVKVEHKAFLTMFDDVSGFGAWHRRWCYLNGNILNYWKYPDDERSQPPIGSIDLSYCKQDVITVAPRDICARMNTLMVQLHRYATNMDRNTLVTFREGNELVHRYLLSCDTKEERNEWCESLNKALQRAKAWQHK